MQARLSQILSLSILVRKVDEGKRGPDSAVFNYPSKVYVGQGRIQAFSCGPVNSLPHLKHSSRRPVYLEVVVRSADDTKNAL